jgi:hypothetical protein
MKETDMKNQEHIVAVVDPSVNEDSTLDLAQQVVDRGGRVTVMVLASRDTVAGMTAFASSEDLTLPDGAEIYLERLAMQYTERFRGQEAAATILTGADASGFVFATAARNGATVLAMPQWLATKRSWRTSVAKSQVPVLIAPPKAA